MVGICCLDIVRCAQLIEGLLGRYELQCSSSSHQLDELLDVSALHNIVSDFWDAESCVGCSDTHIHMDHKLNVTSDNQAIDFGNKT